jgi:hypothetical protein
MCVTMRSSGFGSRILFFFPILCRCIERNQSGWSWGALLPCTCRSQAAASFCLISRAHTTRTWCRQPPRPASIHARRAPVARSNDRPRKMLRRSCWSSTSARHGIERGLPVGALARSSTHPDAQRWDATTSCADQIKRLASRKRVTPAAGPGACASCLAPSGRNQQVFFF